jgi:hypothetical protein
MDEGDEKKPPGYTTEELEILQRAAASAIVSIDV